MSTPLLTPQQEARFRSKIREREDGCWEWQGSIHPRYGYGSMAIGPRGACKHYRAHRLAYVLWVGSIPDDLPLDHVCHSEAVAKGSGAGGSACPHRRCVNPAHLEPVTQRENVLRGASAPAAMAAKTHRLNGHEFTEENTVTPRSGGRQCRTCSRARAKAYADAKRDAPAKPPNAERTHCPQGHPYDEANTIVRPTGRPNRSCRECNRLRCRERYARRKAA